MRHLSLFSGIGGFDLAAQWMGWVNVAHCEIDPFCRQILKYYWPDAITYSDIRKTDFSVHHGTVDIISGGFPCQPYSVAGLRKGKEDDRHLWPEMLRAIREVSPRWVVGENVRGLTNWNGGVVFDEVQADLEAEGYEVLPFILPACAVNAPHRRDRVWFVAHANGVRHGRGSVKPGSNWDREWPIRSDEQDNRHSVWGKNKGCGAVTSNTDHDGFQEKRAEQQAAGLEQHGKLVGLTSDSEGLQNIRRGQEGFYAQSSWVSAERNTPHPSSDQRPEGRMYQTEREASERHISTFNTRNDWRAWENFPTESPVCGGNDGLPTQLDGITFSKWRNESLKAYGNAVVPQVVYRIFKSIQHYDQRRPRN